MSDGPSYTERDELRLERDALAGALRTVCRARGVDDADAAALIPAHLLVHLKGD